MKTRLYSAILALTILFGAVSVYASGEDESTEQTQAMEIIFTNVTNDPGEQALEGEAKIKVSVKGAQGNVVSYVQTTLQFSGNLKYKAIKFLEGENNPPECSLVTPNPAQINASTGNIKTLKPSIIYRRPTLELSDITDLFVLTFEGDPGEEVTLEMNDLENTWCGVLGEGDITPVEEADPITVAASDKVVESRTAIIKLIMDDEIGFTGAASSGYKSSNVFIRIISESEEGYTIYTELNNASISGGGHKDGDITLTHPTFIIENTVLADDTYTVEISGIGYATKTFENVTFREPLEITNADFVPGDVDGDGLVTPDDKVLFYKEMEKNGKTSTCDFNRDGRVDEFDAQAFKNIKDKTTVPEKISDLRATGGDKSVVLTWTAPENGGSEITGYTVNYGKSENKLDSKATVDAKAGTATIDKLDVNTTYYFSVTAENENGSSEAAAVSAKTTSVPGKVTSISTSDITTSAFVISWTAPDNGGSEITGYQIDYGNDTSNLTSKITINDKTALSRTLSNLSSNTTYYFRIAAKNANGLGEYSETHNATTATGSGGGGGGTVGGGGLGGGGGAGAATPTYYTVTFNIGEGTLVSGSLAVNVERNAKPQSAPSIKAPDGKEFAGWSRDNGVSFIDPKNVIVKENISFTAIYKDIEAGNTGTAAEFSDLGNHTWAAEAIYTLKEKGIINGTSPTTFAPANNIKRGDFILILVRMLGLTAEYTENFADVPADSYYADAIGIAKATGIAQGSEGNFRPEETITRQDLITLAYRAFLAKGYITETSETTPLDVFADKADISDYAVSAMASMVKAGIINGSDGKVNPKNNATRAEVAVMCARLLGLMN